MEQMIDEELAKLENLLANHPLIEKYHELEESVEKCKLLKDYEQKIEEAQKELVQARHYQKVEAAKYWEQEANKYQQLLDEHPLVIIYRENLKEVNDLLQLITTTITEQINLEGANDV